MKKFKRLGLDKLHVEVKYKAPKPELVASVRKYGILVPLVVAESGRVIDGRQRYHAAYLAGLTSVPCYVVGDQS